MKPSSPSTSTTSSARRTCLREYGMVPDMVAGFAWVRYTDFLHCLRYSPVNTQVREARNGVDSEGELCLHPVGQGKVPL